MTLPWPDGQPPRPHHGGPDWRPRRPYRLLRGVLAAALYLVLLGLVIAGRPYRLLRSVLAAALLKGPLADFAPARAAELDQDHARPRTMACSAAHGSVEAVQPPDVIGLLFWCPVR